jgi:hypothetical protein
VVVGLVESYKAKGCNMSLKVHFLPDVFQENLGARSDEHGQRFRQDISTMEKRYQGTWIPICWLIIAGHLEETFQGKVYRRKSYSLTS